jgi:hypothetical protein
MIIAIGIIPFISVLQTGGTAGVSSVYQNVDPIVFSATITVNEIMIIFASASGLSAPGESAKKFHNMIRSPVTLEKFPIASSEVAQNKDTNHEQALIQIRGVLGTMSARNTRTGIRKYVTTYVA